jgi:hypothetical protein
MMSLTIFRVCGGLKPAIRNRDAPRGHKWPLFHEDANEEIPVLGILPQLCRNLLASGFPENSNREIRRRPQFWDGA